MDHFTLYDPVELKLYFRKMKYIFDFNVIHFDNFCHESNRLKYIGCFLAPPSIYQLNLFNHEISAVRGGSY